MSRSSLLGNHQLENVSKLLCEQIAVIGTVMNFSSESQFYIAPKLQFSLVFRED